jgi:ATP-dependent protease Clp ATPase subunit
LDDFYCSFCDRARRAVRKLISGPRAFICDGCVLTSIQLASSGGPNRTPSVELLPGGSGATGQPENCSMCGKHRRESRLAFRHRDLHSVERVICAECIGLCVDILNEEFPIALSEEVRSWPEASKE